MAVRGLGWDIDSPYASNRGELFPVGSFGHSGFTGTSLWIDPLSKTYVIILTNSVHPDGKGNVIALRSRIATIAAAALGMAAIRNADGQPNCRAAPAALSAGAQFPFRNEQQLSCSNRCETAKWRPALTFSRRRAFTPLKGMRVGLITNHSGRDSQGRRTIDLLATRRA